MSAVFQAIWQDGAFQPLEPVQLPEKQLVTVHVAALLEPLSDDLDDTEPIWRGVFAPPRQDKQLFDTVRKIDLDEFPKLEPDVTIDPRWFEENNDDNAVV